MNYDHVPSRDTEVLRIMSKVSAELDFMKAYSVKPMYVCRLLNSPDCSVAVRAAYLGTFPELMKWVKV